MPSKNRKARTALLVGALSLAGPTWAIDWDGDFPNTGNYDGKIDDPMNWDFMGLDILPGPTVGVDFLANAAYTVSFNTDFETAAFDVINGDVAFASLSSIQDYTYSVNGVRPSPRC